MHLNNVHAMQSCSNMEILMNENILTRPDPPLAIFFRQSRRLIAYYGHLPAHIFVYAQCFHFQDLRNEQVLLNVGVIQGLFIHFICPENVSSEHLPLMNFAMLHNFMIVIFTLHILFAQEFR